VSLYKQDDIIFILNAQPESFTQSFDRSEIQASSITSLAGIAEALDARDVRTACGGAWHTSTVHNLLSRAPA
jgi:4-hydroxyphenylpyruvate dioxygenase-like putative hemolysin